MENRTIDITDFKKCLSKISIKELNERIKYFRRVVYAKYRSEEHIVSELKKLFTVKIDGDDKFFFLYENTLTYDFHHYFFYRIRKMSKDDSLNLRARIFQDMKEEKDAWYPPDEINLKYGRLNRPSNSVLYVSNSIETAMYETKIKEGDFFYLIVYENISKMRLAQIHEIPYFEELTEEDNAKLIILQSFLFSEFTKYVLEGREYLYKTSLLIYEHFFFNPYIDAFRYPSIASDSLNAFNLCFSKEKAKKNLQLVTVSVYKREHNPPNATFGCKIFWDGFIENGVFSWYSPKSEIARNKLGNYAFTRDIEC